MLTDDDVAARFAHAFREQASRTLPAEVDAAAIFRRARRQQHRQIATRVASVVAAAGLVTGLVIARSAPSSPVPPPGQLPGNTLLDAQVVPTLSAQAADADLPSYYIVASDPKLAPLEVRSSATGKVVSTFSPPAACDPKSLSLAAAANHRDFVFACSTSARSTSFYRLRISPSGKASALTPLSIPGSGGWGAEMALSADGSKLAIVGDGIEVVTLATGAVRTWTAPGAELSNLTWSGDGRELGYWTTGGLYVLNVSGAGSRPGSARLALPRTVGSDDVDDAVLSPDGAIIASVTYQSDFRNLSLNPNSVVGGIVEVSATTGRPLRTLLAQRLTNFGPGQGGYAITSCQLGAIDATGHHLLVSCNQFGRLDRGRFTPLPGPGAAGALYTSAW